MIITSFSIIKKVISPLDIIFFRGNDEPVSDLIAWFEKECTGKGDWTHVGIVVNSEICDLGLKKGKWYVLESTMSRFTKVPDELSGKGFFGVQIRDLEKLCLDYSGNMSLGKLLNNPYEISPIKTKKLFPKILKKYLHTGYDYNLISLLSVPIRCCRPIRDKFINTRGRYFCSELIGYILQDLEMLKDKNPSDMFPVDFTDRDIVSTLIMIKLEN